MPRFSPSDILPHSSATVSYLLDDYAVRLLLHEEHGVKHLHQHVCVKVLQEEQNESHESNAQLSI